MHKNTAYAQPVKHVAFVLVGVSEHGHIPLRDRIWRLCDWPYLWLVSRETQRNQNHSSGQRMPFLTCTPYFPFGDLQHLFSCQISVFGVSRNPRRPEVVAFIAYPSEVLVQSLLLALQALFLRLSKAKKRGNRLRRVRSFLLFFSPAFSTVTPAQRGR